MNQIIKYNHNSELHKWQVNIFHKTLNRKLGISIENNSNSIILKKIDRCKQINHKKSYIKTKLIISILKLNINIYIQIL
jgi:hypothetical protein